MGLIFSMFRLKEWIKENQEKVKDRFNILLVQVTEEDKGEVKEKVGDGFYILHVQVTGEDKGELGEGQRWVCYSQCLGYRRG